MQCQGDRVSLPQKLCRPCRSAGCCGSQPRLPHCIAHLAKQACTHLGDELAHSRQAVGKVALVEVGQNDARIHLWGRRKRETNQLMWGLSWQLVKVGQHAAGLHPRAKGQTGVASVPRRWLVARTQPDAHAPLVSCDKGGSLCT